MENRSLKNYHQLPIMLEGASRSITAAIESIAWKNREQSGREKEEYNAIGCPRL